MWNHNEVRTAQINKGSKIIDRLPHPNGPYGTHQELDQENTLKQPNGMPISEPQDVSQDEILEDNERKADIRTKRREDNR